MLEAVRSDSRLDARGQLEVSAALTAIIIKSEQESFSLCVRTEILVKLPQYDAPATQTARRSNPIQEQNTLGTGRQAEETDLVYGQAKRKTVDILLCALLI